MKTGRRFQPPFFVPVSAVRAAAALACLAVVSSVVDAARVLSQPGYAFLARGLMGRLDCPADANPPVARVDWFKDGRRLALPLGAGGTHRLSLNADDWSLNFAPVLTEDAGRYSCTPYSSLGVGQTSNPVHVLVKGTHPPFCFQSRFRSCHSFICRT